MKATNPSAVCGRYSWQTLRLIRLAASVSQSGRPEQAQRSSGVTVGSGVQNSVFAESEFGIAAPRGAKTEF
jgi:hypothetical protein